MRKLSILIIFQCMFLTASYSQAQSVHTIDDYNNRLPVWGTSWTGGEGKISHYYPSFYTGFAPRSQFPERIHIRTSRGNQTRVSVILDEQTVQDYLFDLVTRYEFYKEMTQSQNGRKVAADIAPKKADLLPQVESYFGIIESSEYNILGLTSSATKATVLSEDFYANSLEVMDQLNPGRLFHLNIDLTESFLEWKNQIIDLLDGNAPEKVLTKNAKETVIAINSLVWGRINLVDAPSEELLAKLHKAASSALNNNVDAFVSDALALFQAATGDKYNFKTLNEKGQWINPIQCESSQCWLRYSEFTTIYPTGSYEGSTKDRFGNRIPRFATPGLWPFLDRNYHEVDHIRKEPYYGFAPKLDYEGVGNGFHNPAVRFYGSQFSKAVKELLGAPESHKHLWAVTRGGISSGCLRLSLGHVWEMRHIMPVENSKMKQVYHFGNDSKDFDLYDIDGNGELEVMGVEYLISYNTQGTSGLAKRDGANLKVGVDDKIKFYENLYGSKNVFTLSNGTFIFNEPSVSFQSHLDLKKKRVQTSMTLEGSYPLYEQVYERDKAQLYLPITTKGLTTVGNSDIGDRLVRLMGRVRGCAPTSDQVDCGAKAFEDEKKSVLKAIY